MLCSRNIKLLNLFKHLRWFLILGMVNNQIMYPRGKVAGGTSAIDELMYVRGNPYDYDTWAELGGVDWTYESLLPYFKMHENSKINGDAGYHAKGGPLNVETPKEPHPLLDTFLEANTELGRNIIDYNGKNHLGASATQFFTQKGIRESGGNVFLKKLLKNQQFEISKNSFATKIIIDERRTASGVEFVKKGNRYKAYAKKEVILAAGAINTPQLLMLSGIGPQEELQRHGIDVVQNLQVGSMLNDHPVFFGLTFSTNYTFNNGSIHQLVEQYLNGHGPLTMAGNYAGVSYIHTPGSAMPNYVPNIELIFAPINSYSNFSKKTYNLNNDTLSAYFDKIEPDSSFRILVVLLHPKSKGNVTLEDTDPMSFPNIDLGLLSDEEDVETIYQGILEALKLVETKQFRAINATLIDPQLKGCKEHKFLTKECWQCYIRHLTASMSHPSGTAKMGNPKEPDTVVDNNLRVFGVERLRVADSSVVPVTLSGHITPLAYVIGAKAADFIVEQHCL